MNWGLRVGAAARAHLAMTVPSFSMNGRRRIIGLLSVSIKNKGKQRDVKRTVTKFMDENFIWKDPHAAQKVGISTTDYVVGGMDHDLKLRLYRLLRALDDSSELAMLVTARLRRPTHTLVQRRLLANFSDQFDRGESRHAFCCSLVR